MGGKKQVPRVRAVPSGRINWGVRAGLATAFLWFLIGGIAHFAATELEMRIVPPWVPWPRAAVLASGAVELLGAAALLWPRDRKSVV